MLLDSLAAKPDQVPQVLVRAMLAREAPVALVLRRGPKEWTQAVLWHTDTDEFEPGQWFHGTIRSANISPDGKVWSYWAVKYHLERKAKSGQYPAMHYRWVALAKLPYFTALALWDIVELQLGIACFPDSNTVLMLAGENKRAADPSAGSLRPGMKLRGVSQIDLEDRCEKLTGWELLRETDHTRTLSKAPSAESDISLEYARGYKVVFNEGKKKRSVALDASWADFDQAGRVVYTKDGKLWACTVEGTELTPHELYDFRPHKVEEIAAPDWARTW